LVCIVDTNQYGWYFSDYLFTAQQREEVRTIKCRNEMHGKIRFAGFAVFFRLFISKKNRNFVLEI